MLNNVELEKICRVYCRELWNHELSIPIVIDGRIKNSLAYFQHYDQKNDNESRKNLALRIKISRRLLENYNDDTIKSVILHELTHYYLFVQGSNEYDDGSAEFERELSRIGAHSTKKIKLAGKIYEFRCKKCGGIVASTDNKRKAEKWTNGYKSRCCRSGLIITEKNVVDKTNVLKTSIKTSNIDDILRKK